MASIHVPVLGPQVLESLAIDPSGTYVDGTFGGGGHSRLILEKLGPQGRLIGVDRDPDAVGAADLPDSAGSWEVVHGSYVDLPRMLTELEIDAVDGIVLDLGLSSDQLADADRGFSFQASGELDLRFDRTAGEPAWKMLNRLSESTLADMIYQWGEDRMSRRIARAIVAARRDEPIRQATQLADIIRAAVPRSHKDRIDPATRTFQALRIAVNDELSHLQQALRSLPELLNPSGRLAIISFHSLEDRIVKEHFREDPRLDVLTRKPIRADDTEIAMNRRSRSSRLRVAARRNERQDN